MTEHIWHRGPPPHIGWWNASIGRKDDVWRWWNGKTWSFCVYDYCTAERAGHCATLSEDKNFSGFIEWSDYWPENARVPRINPK